MSDTVSTKSTKPTHSICKKVGTRNGNEFETIGVAWARDGGGLYIKLAGTQIIEAAFMPSQTRTKTQSRAAIRPSLRKGRNISMLNDDDITARIAALNDQFRRNPFNSDLGRFFCSFRIADISDKARAEAILRMGNFTRFNKTNDPHGLHDFGRIKIEGTPKLCWKIEVFADKSLTFGSNAPHDPQRSYRTITLMLDKEYGA